MGVIGVVAGLVLGFAMIRALLNFFYHIEVNQLVQAEIVVNLRDSLYDKMQRLSFRFFDANASSSLINRITGDVQALRSFVDQVVIQILIMLLSLVVYVIYMLNIHVGLTIACLIATPLLGFASTAFSRIVQPAFIRNRRLIDAMISRFTENFRGIHVVKAFGPRAAGDRGFSTRGRGSAHAAALGLWQSELVRARHFPAQPDQPRRPARLRRLAGHSRPNAAGQRAGRFRRHPDPVFRADFKHRADCEYHAAEPGRRAPRLRSGGCAHRHRDRAHRVGFGQSAGPRCL